MTVFESISMYIMLGCINNLIIMLLLDWVDRKGGLTQRFHPTTEQVVIGLLIWPITGWVFWSEFFKTWWEQWKDEFDKRNRQ